MWLRLAQNDANGMLAFFARSGKAYEQVSERYSEYVTQGKFIHCIKSNLEMQRKIYATAVTNHDAVLPADEHYAPRARRINPPSAAPMRGPTIGIGA
jgi:hypothetical protein